MTQQQPSTVDQEQFNDIYKLLLEIRQRRKAKQHAGRDLRQS